MSLGRNIIQSSIQELNYFIRYYHEIMLNSLSANENMSCLPQFSFTSLRLSLIPVVILFLSCFPLSVCQKTWPSFTFKLPHCFLQDLACPQKPRIASRPALCVHACWENRVTTLREINASLSRVCQKKGLLQWSK
jgi:hypothetical protein